MNAEMIRELVPPWVWLFFFGERKITVDGYYVHIEITTFLWSNTRRIQIGLPEWHNWLSENDSFTFYNIAVCCLFRKEQSGKYEYWYAYKWNEHLKHNERLYVGRLDTFSSLDIIRKACDVCQMAQCSKEDRMLQRRTYKRLRTLRKNRRQKAATR